MRHIISVLLENESGALSRVVGLFSQRGYNIETLTVAPTEDPTLSRMTIVTMGDERVLEQIQSEQIGRIFGQELETRLDLRSRESLMRFDQYLAQYAATTRLVAKHRLLAEHLEPEISGDVGADLPPGALRADGGGGAVHGGAAVGT